MYDVIVIGAGAAGLMAAGIAARSGKQVLLLEKMEKPGRKIRITGKGRCNLTNMREKVDFMSHVRANAEFFGPAFKEFDNKSLLSFFKRQKVDLTVERGDRVFPTSGDAWEIANALVDWCKDMGVEILCHTPVVGIKTLGKKVSGVEIITKRGFPRKIEAPNVIICTGGVSYPATGSTGDGYKFAYDLGHDIEEVRPSLVPLEFRHPQSDMLAGVSLKNVNVELLIDGVAIKEEFGELMFSNRGIEGAVIIRLSRDAVDALIEEKKVELSLDLKSALTEEVIHARIIREMEELPSVAKFSEVLRKLLPKQFVEPMATQIGIAPNTKLENIGENEIAQTIKHLKDFRVEITDYRPFEEAIVTAGGVDVSQIDPTTMESYLVKGLFFAGEVLDIDGDTGGYNLQIAFSTGALAGQLAGYVAPERTEEPTEETKAEKEI